VLVRGACGCLVVNLCFAQYARELLSSVSINFWHKHSHTHTHTHTTTHTQCTHYHTHSIFAGAGLYESITMDTTETRRVDYMSDKLVQDPEYRQKLLARICKVRGFSRFRNDITRTSQCGRQQNTCFKGKTCTGRGAAVLVKKTETEYDGTTFFME